VEKSDQVRYVRDLTEWMIIAREKFGKIFKRATDRPNFQGK